MINDKPSIFGYLPIYIPLHSCTPCFYLILFHHISLLLVVNISSAFFLSQHSKVIPSCWCDNYCELGMGKRYKSLKCASFNNIYPMLSPGTPYKVCWLVLGVIDVFVHISDKVLHTETWHESKTFMINHHLATKSGLCLILCRLTWKLSWLIYFWQLYLETQV